MRNKRISEIIKNYSFACISGVFLIFCFSPFDLYGLAWFVLVPFLFSLYDKEPKQAFRIGIVFGIPYFFGTLYWIYHSINNYGHVPLIISLVVVILLCLYLSLYTGLFAFIFSITIKTTRLPSLLIAPIFWVVLEYLRSYLLTGFPWSSIGYTQYKLLNVIQISDITGVYGVSFLLLAVNGAIADLFIIRRRLRDMPLFPMFQTVIGLSVLSIVIISILIYGHWRQREERPGKQITVSIIQGNIEQDKKWEPVYQNAVIETYKELSLKAVSVSPSLIIWPETSLPFLFKEDKELTKELLDFQKHLDTYLLLGSVLLKGKNDGKYILSNSAVLLDNTGKVVYIYDKIHLVPFGEYVPLKKILFFIDKLVVGIGDYSQGNQYLKASTPFGRFATLICYEIIFPGLVRKFYTDGGDFIVNITNDAWFGKTSGPYQHFSMAVFRAVENRKPLIRAANTGISGFIDSNGKIISTTKLFQKEILTKQIKTDSTRSIYTKYGDLFMYICIVFSVILLTNIITKLKKNKRI